MVCLPVCCNLECVAQHQCFADEQMCISIVLCYAIYVFIVSEKQIGCSVVDCIVKYKYISNINSIGSF